MYQEIDRVQREFSAFDLDFSGALDRENRWVKMSGLIPWDELEPLYKHHFSHKGRPAKRFRVALGSLIIQETLKLSDRDTVQAISENVYLQFFLGFPGFRKGLPFDASLLTLFRKRLDWKNIATMNDKIATLRVQQHAATTTSQDDSDKKNDDDDPADQPPKKDTATEISPENVVVPNEGTIIVDATCTPADIRYPHDLTLLDEARRGSERIIDRVWSALDIPKPRTYRIKARMDFLRAVKNRKKTKSQTRRALRKQLNYLRRNLEAIQHLVIPDPTRAWDPRRILSKLSTADYKMLLVINEVYRQQEALYRQNNHTVADRIVSIQQPHVRPIVRGKARSSVEFGAKVSVCVSQGLLFVDRMSFDAYSESHDVILHAEAYRRRTGCYPETILGDKAYQNQANRRWCKERNIRLMGKIPGRPYEEPIIQKAIEKMHRSDERGRVAVEGKIGVQKRKYRWNTIMGKRVDTSFSMIMLSVLAANIQYLIRAGIFYLSFAFKQLCNYFLKFMFAPRSVGNWALVSD